MDIILIAIGGALGSIARYSAGRAISGKAGNKFPYGTFIINISGAFLLGLLNGAGAGRSVSLLFADGFLGAYTTFSTFMYESFNLLNSRKLNALIYILSTLVLGMLGFSLGYAAGSLILF